MAKHFDSLQDDHQTFIAEQPLFFSGTAGVDGRVNISPKGMESLRILGPNRIAWLNLTGSGNETAGHVLELPRITLMWCSFSKRPLILRCYGTARAIHPGDPDWADMAALFPPHRSARQIFDIAVDLVQTSCGYAIPFMEYLGERPTMQHWIDSKSDADIRAHWARQNTETIDGKPTGIPT